MIDLSRPVNLTSEEFVNNKYEWYERIREEKPVCQAKISVIKVFTLARYEDCADILRDPRVLHVGTAPETRIRNRHLSVSTLWRHAADHRIAL